MNPNNTIDHTEDIQELFKEEQNRNFKRPPSGFCISQSEYNGTNPEVESESLHQ